MKALVAAIGLVFVAVSCGPSYTVVPPATAATAPAFTATPTPKPSPIISAKGFITVTSPTTNAKLQSPVIISGDASVFEAALQWRITDQGGRVIAEGLTTASQGAPGRGTFTVSAPFTVAAETVAFVEVFSRSPKDGNIDDLVRVPVTLR